MELRMEEPNTEGACSPPVMLGAGALLGRAAISLSICHFIVL